MNKIIIGKLGLLLLTLFCFTNAQAKIIDSLLPEKQFTNLISLSNFTKHIRPLLYTKKKTKVLAVTATAYTSHEGQTDSTPNIAAWGDKLSPGMKVIAVSRDLLNEYGLKHRSKVKIRGLSGEYLVLDKMNRRWHKKIDIYMGKNRHEAFKWGRRKVIIEWIPEKV